MERTQILLGEMAPSLCQQLRHVIAAQSDLEIVGAPNRRGMELLVEVRTSRPEASIIGARNGAIPGECTHLLNEFPNLKILAVPSDKRPAVLHELREQVTSVSHVSPENLIAVIRSAVRTREKDADTP